MRIALILSFLITGSALAQKGPAPDFIPDYIFEGSTFDGWEITGEAEWEVEDGVITGTANAAGGILMFDDGLQDVAFFSKFMCEGACDAGILLRLEESMAGMKGIMVALDGEKVQPYRVVLDKKGRLVKKELAYDAAQPYRPSQWSLPTKIEEGWNDIEVFVNENEIENHLNNQRHATQGGLAQIKPPFSKINPAATPPDGFGQVGLYVGSGTVQFTGVSIKDLNLMTIAPEMSSDRFRVQRINDYAYAWGADAGDVNNDGELDIISGPFYYLGPDFLKRGEYYPARTYSSGEEYVQNMLTFVHDWTGDGWPDILMTEMRPLTLYINPQGESRRWDRVAVLPKVCSEIAFRGDLDSDGVDEIAYISSDGHVSYGEPDPENLTGPWLVRTVSEKVGVGTTCSAHGLGIGDVNGDGRLDVLQTHGWWEQPATDPAGGTWTHHKTAFGRSPNPYGGGAISVYDFNDDGLNDVVASLEAHGWGLAWFEQKRDGDGVISFDQHMIMDNYATKNAGDVTFSQMHAGAILADIDQDGIMDFVTGKRHWAHLDSLTDPDTIGDGVVYWYRTVRNADAAGGVEFVPELIHNKSGVGSEVKAIDINKDGAMDILAAGSRGTFVFWGNPTRR